MPKVTVRRVTIVALMVVLGFGGALAWAAIPDGSGVIRGCYQKNNGSLRVVDEGVACLSSEQAIEWNQQGIQGEPGETGETGAAGPRGPSDAWHTPGASVDLSDAEWHDVASLTLPEGSYVLTGRGSVGNVNANDWYSFCALQAPAGELTRMRVDMHEGPFNYTPFVLTAVVSLTESGDVTLACQGGSSPDGTVPNPSNVADSALTALQVATLH